MLAWLTVCSLTLLSAASDGTHKSVEIPAEVRRAVAEASPDQIAACLDGLGRKGIRAAWIVHLGLAADPLAEQKRAVGTPWADNLASADPVELIESLRAVLPKEVTTFVCRRALERLSRLEDAAAIKPMVDLVLRMPDGALQGERTLAWVTDAFVRVGRTARFVVKPLEEEYDRLPRRAHAALDIALLAAGSGLPLRSWEGRRLQDRELLQRLRLLETAAPAFGTSVDADPILSVLMGLSSSHPSVQVRSRAARCLGAMGATSVIAHLIELAHESDEMAAKAAMEALTHCARVHWPRSAMEWDEWWSLEERWIMTELAAGMNALVNDEPGKRAAGLRVLLEHPAAASLMADAIGDAAVWTNDDSFGCRVALGLASLPGPEPRQALARIAEEGSPALREAALGALKKL